MRKKLVELLDGMGGDTRKDITKPDERVEFVQFARGNEAAQDRHRFSAAIAAQERPVVSTMELFP